MDELEVVGLGDIGVPVGGTGPAVGVGAPPAGGGFAGGGWWDAQMGGVGRFVGVEIYETALLA